VLRQGFPRARIAHSITCSLDTAFCQDQLDIPQAEFEYVVQPDGVAYDLGREPVAVVRVGWRRHPTSLVALWACCQSRLP
jgi:hypothetical protein